MHVQCMHARSCALGSTAAWQRAASLPDPPEGRHCRTSARDCPLDKSSDAAWQVEVWAGELASVAFRFPTDSF